jgi:hypothetical protein
LSQDKSVYDMHAEAGSQGKPGASRCIDLRHGSLNCAYMEHEQNYQDFYSSDYFFLISTYIYVFARIVVNYACTCTHFEYLHVHIRYEFHVTWTSLSNMYTNPVRLNIIASEQCFQIFPAKFDLIGRY